MGLKRVVIPTAYDGDTLEAMKIALRAGYEEENIILVSTTEISDSIQTLLFLSAEEAIDQKSRRILMRQWAQHCGKRNNGSSWSVREHHQFGMSSAIAATLAGQFDAGLVIVPASVTHNAGAYRQLIAALEKGKCPVMQLPLPVKKINKQGLLRTLLVGEHDDSVPDTIDGIELDIVHHLEDADHNEDFVRLLVDALSIELIIQRKRGGHRTFLRASKSPDIAVLSV